MPRLAAVLTAQGNALALHLALGAAGAAAEQDAAETVGTGGAVDVDIVLALPGKAVEGKDLIQHGVQLGHGSLRDLLRRQQAAHMGADGHIFPLLQAIIQRFPGKSAGSGDGDHRHLQLFQQHAHLPGQGRGGAVKGVAGLGVHQHAALLLTQSVLHIADEPHIADELIGGDGAHQTQDPVEAHEGVGGADEGQAVGEENAVGGLHIDKAGVVHEDEARLFPAHQLHTLGGIAEPGRQQVRDGQQTDQAAQQEAGPQGLAMLRAAQSHHLRIAFLSNGDLHNEASCRFRICGRSVTESIRQISTQYKIFPLLFCVFRQKRGAKAPLLPYSCVSCSRQENMRSPSPLMPQESSVSPSRCRCSAKRCPAISSRW